MLNLNQWGPMAKFCSVFLEAIISNNAEVFDPWPNVAVILKLPFINSLYTISWPLPMRMPWDLINNGSKLFQVMPLCCMASRHYLKQCWPRYMLPCSVTRPQWVKRVLCVARQQIQMQQLASVLQNQEGYQKLTPAQQQTMILQMLLQQNSMGKMPGPPLQTPVTQASQQQQRASPRWDT